KRSTPCCIRSFLSLHELSPRFSPRCAHSLQFYSPTPDDHRSDEAVKGPRVHTYRIFQCPLRQSFSGACSGRCRGTDRKASAAPVPLYTTKPLLFCREGLWPPALLFVSV